MKRRRLLPILVVAGALPAWASPPPEAPQAGGPTTAPADAGVPAATEVDPAAGQLFTSRGSGFAFAPPAGGTIWRNPTAGTGEVVRFTYGKRAWDLRVRVVPIAKPTPLVADPAHGVDKGVLDMEAADLSAAGATAGAAAAADVLTREAVTIGRTPVGLIEVRSNSGTNRQFTQMALFHVTDQRYLVLQMFSPGRPKDDAVGPAPAGPGAATLTAGEAQARRVFRGLLPTVRLLDLAALKAEQDARIAAAETFVASIDEAKLRQACREQTFVRVVRDGRDVGLVQIDEHPAARGKQEGVEVVVQSMVVQPPTPAEPAGPPQADADAAAAPAKPAGNGGGVDSQSIYFVTYDRRQERWQSMVAATAFPPPGAVAPGGGPAKPTRQTTVESGNSDWSSRRAIDQKEVARRQHDPSAIPIDPKTGRPDKQAPVVEKLEGRLSVQRYAGQKQGKEVKRPLGLDYLSQAAGQMLPELLPRTPGQYLFQWYVGSQGDTFHRYVDVKPPAAVTIDGERVTATAVEDRIGVDAPPTTHYVSADGRWLGDVTPDGTTWYLPTDLATLKGIWPKFHVYGQPKADEELEERGTTPRRPAPPTDRRRATPVPGMDDEQPGRR